jgi:hypothetical protein
MGKIKLSLAQDTIILITLLLNCSSICPLARVIQEVRRLPATELYRIFLKFAAHTKTVCFTAVKIRASKQETQ